ncbi:YdcF family protein [[Bacillus] enclensis]|uniref:YdcF family protein n=1 Tax=[Bacillus] enclensis TaxID=1402860 RepID=UPI0018DB7F13|nr:YdcF family protein [[Bacillus] enclensis]MBH9965288.1 YdcF family protein [[Bacillus] enclensis]
MKPIIQKEIDMPQLSPEHIDYITELTFGKVEKIKSCDAIFVFAGTHPGHWEKAIEAYNLNLAPKVIVTGGRSLTGESHPDWSGRSASAETEASIIISYLVKAGIPEENITFEDQSSNSLENVLYAKDLIDFKKITSLLVICKSHAAGRQIRTLQKHFPETMEYIPFSFDTIYKNTTVSRHNWMNSDLGKKRVWGEYQRIVHYGQLGHLIPPTEKL